MDDDMIEHIHDDSGAHQKQTESIWKLRAIGALILTMVFALAFGCATMTKEGQPKGAFKVKGEVALGPDAAPADAAPLYQSLLAGGGCVGQSLEVHVVDSAKEPIPGVLVKGWDPVDYVWREGLTDETGSITVVGVGALKLVTAGGIDVDVQADLANPCNRRGLAVR